MLQDSRMRPTPRDVEALVKTAKVLIVDDEYFTRKVIRTLLLSVGVSDIHDASDGPSGLRAIRAFAPDVVILDWEMPGMSGVEFARTVRSPIDFPYPDVPIIMLSGHGERSRVLEALQHGVHEFLLKPVSSRALFARIAAVLSAPRTMVKCGDYYGPEPRKLSAYKPVTDSYNLRADQVVTPVPTYRLFS
jgi:two-component system chemotaxis response regulator CheY